MTKPIEKLRDGAVSAAIWKNQSEDGQIFYAVTYDRTYSEGEGDAQEVKSANSFSGTAILKQQRLAGKAYDRIKVLEAADRAAASNG